MSTGVPTTSTLASSTLAIAGGASVLAATCDDAAHGRGTSIARRKLDGAPARVAHHDPRPQHLGAGRTQLTHIEAPRQRRDRQAHRVVEHAGHLLSQAAGWQFLAALQHLLARP